MKDEGWRRGYGGGIGYEGGRYSRIIYELARMERVEHNNTIRNYFMNEDGIENLLTV